MASKKIVLLGLGHTNAHIVRQWQRSPIENCSLTCVSVYPIATYSGMLPGTLGSQFRDDEMRIDLTRLCDRASAKLLLAQTRGIDLNTGQLHFAEHPSVSFDALSIGIGSIPAGMIDLRPVPSLIPIKPMQTFLERLMQRVRWIRDTKGCGRIVIVGGGAASIEIAFCLQQQLKHTQLDSKFTLEISTSGKQIAADMTPRSIRHIERLLGLRRIAVNYECRITDVQEDHIVSKDGRQYPADVVIWATGAEAPPLLNKLGLQTDERGFVATTSTLQSLTDPRIFAVGDSGTVLDFPTPKAGVFAVRQSPILWHNLNALMTGKPLKKFHPQTKFLKLLNTGDGKAMLEYRNLTLHTRLAWHLKTWIDKQFVTEFQTDME